MLHLDGPLSQADKRLEDKKNTYLDVTTRAFPEKIGMDPSPGPSAHNRQQLQRENPPWIWTALSNKFRGSMVCHLLISLNTSWIYFHINFYFRFSAVFLNCYINALLCIKFILLSFSVESEWPGLGTNLFTVSNGSEHLKASWCL